MGPSAERTIEMTNEDRVKCCVENMDGDQPLRIENETLFRTTPTSKQESFGLKNIGKEFGTIKWTRADWIQTYEGDVFNGCLHGYGTYTWYHNGPKHVYEGYFYANKKEGYGRMSFPDGGVFEGLHKSNIRYGPGEYTYPDGTQDVGLWIGNKLVRLFNPVEAAVPKLSTTMWGKDILPAYKKRIFVKSDTVHKVYNLLEQRGVSSDQKYDLHSNDPRSCFFNKVLYDEIYFSSSDSSSYRSKEIVSILNNSKDEIKSSLSEKMEAGHFSDHQVLSINKSNKQNSLKTSSMKSISIKDVEKAIIAWNNTPTMTSLQQHSYQHHKFIENMAFSLLYRGNQRLPGDHEMQCTEFLEACQEGNLQIVSHLLMNKGIFPDVMDSDGNSGLLIASMYKHEDVINNLLNLGADVNHTNDECLNALNICILQYISEDHDIYNWEQSFLYQKQPVLQDKKKSEYWNPFRSFFIREETGHAYTLNFSERRQEFRMNTGYQPMTTIYRPKHDTDTSSTGSNGNELKPILRSSNTTLSRTTSSVIFKEPAEEFQSERMENTIKILLERGANPNSCEVPFFTLMLAVYSRNVEFVQLLLEFGANPNTISEPADGGLTILHTITMLPASDITLAMCRILLQYGADPNIKTKADNENDMMEKEFGHNILKYDVDDDKEINKERGRTALHTLCMRPDIAEDKKILRTMCTLILQRSSVNASILHMGHTPLALAIRKGDMDLVKQFLCSGMVDPNQKLGPGLGVPLTLLLSNNCSSLDPGVKLEMMNLLLEYGADPFLQVTVGDFTGNAVEYARWIREQDDEKLKLQKTKDKNIKEKGKQLKKNKTFKNKDELKKESKQPTNIKTREKFKSKKIKEEALDNKNKKLKGKTEEQNDIINNLLAHMRFLILRFVQGFVVRQLLQLAMYQDEMDETSINYFPEEIERFIELAANMLTPEDVLRCLWIMKSFKIDYITEEQAIEILNLIVKYIDIQTEVDYRKQYNDLICDKTKFWMTLDEQLQKDETELEKQEKKRISVTEKQTLAPKKQKRTQVSRPPVTAKIQELQELEIEHYKWGISLGKYEKQQKASATKLIQDLPSSLKCLSTFVSSVCLIKINLLFSRYTIIPELNRNPEMYRVCFECGRVQGVILRTCGSCGLVSFCSEECKRISTLHHCSADSPWEEETEIKIIELDKDIEDITQPKLETVSIGRQKLEGTYKIKKTEKKDDVQMPQKDNAGKQFKSTKNETQIKQQITDKQKLKFKNAETDRKETKLKRDIEMKLSDETKEKAKIKKELKSKEQPGEIISLKSSEIGGSRVSVSDMLVTMKKKSSMEMARRRESKIISETIKRMSSLKLHAEKMSDKKIKQTEMKAIKDLIKKEISSMKSKKPKKPEEDYEYLFSIFRPSMTHFKSNAQLLPNAFMADSDIYYKLYKDSPLININHNVT